MLISILGFVDICYSERPVSSMVQTTLTLFGTPCGSQQPGFVIAFQWIYVILLPTVFDLISFYPSFAFSDLINLVCVVAV